MNHKKAAMLAARVLKDFVISRIESVVDEGKSVKHSKLAEQTEESISNPAKVRRGEGEGGREGGEGGGAHATRQGAHVRAKDAAHAATLGAPAP